MSINQNQVYNPMVLTPLKARLCAILSTSVNHRLGYHALAERLWPQDTQPNAWRRSGNGGPHGWAMPLGRAIRELSEAGVVYHAASMSKGWHGDVVLMRKDISAWIMSS